MRTRLFAAAVLLLALAIALFPSAQMQIGPSGHSLRVRSSVTTAAEAELPLMYSGGDVQRVEVARYDSITDALAAVNSGEADVFGHRIPFDNVTVADGYSSLSRQWMYDNRAVVLALNARSYPLNSHHLRRAIAYAVNKTAISDQVFGGLVDVADYMLPLTSRYSPDRSGTGLFYNSDYPAAIEELTLAGMLDVDVDGYVEAPHGHDLTLRIAVPLDLPGMNETAILVRTGLVAIGLNSTIVYFNQTYLQNGVANHTLDYDLALYQMDFPYFDPSWGVLTFSGARRTEYGENIANINDPTLNEIAAAVNREYDHDLRVNLTRQALRVVRDYCPVLPLFFYRSLSVYSTANFDNWPHDWIGGAFSVWTPVTVTPREGSDGTLRVAVLPEFFDGFFTSLNPFVNSPLLDESWLWRDHFNPYLLVYDTPLVVRGDGEVVPRNAVRWKMELAGMASDVGNNESRAVFYLDSTGNFTDGTELTAQDYGFTFEFLSNRSLIPRAADFVEAKVIGDYKVGIKFKQPDVFLYRSVSALPILPRHIWSDKNVTEWDPSPEEVIGSGPFTVESFTPHASLVLETNEHYYPTLDNAPPQLQFIRITPDDPVPTISVLVRVFLLDKSPIERVVVNYIYDKGPLNFTESIEMVETPVGYYAIIPAHITATFVEFWITATDMWNNTGVVVSGRYTLPATTGQLLLTTVGPPAGGAAVVLVALAVLVRRRGRRGAAPRPTRV